MRITWVTRSFLDYRIPVYKALDELCNHQLTLIYYKDVVPERVRNKIKHVLGDRAIELSGEYRMGGNKKDNATMANKGLRIPIQPGLIKAIKKSNPNIMISDGFFQWTYAPLIVRMLARIPHVMCYERTKHTERNAGTVRTIYRKIAMRWMDAIDCNGKLTEEYIKELGYKRKITHGHMVADTVELVAKSIDVKQQEITELRNQLKCKQQLYLYVGQLIPRKGIVEMLNAWKKAALNHSTLLLVGDGSQRKEIEELISKEQIPDVIVYGSIDYDSIAVYYKLANCFIIPTLEDNWSLVVPEAMACGLPILCSKYNGCWPELVKPENGWVFDPLDRASLVDALNKSYQNKDKLTEMGEKSKEIVSRHTPEIAARGIWEACEMSLKQ